MLLAYRRLAVDYRDGGFVFDVVQQGPAIGLDYRFRVAQADGRSRHSATDGGARNAWKIGQTLNQKSDRKACVEAALSLL